jgi:hypothetical protein
VCLTSTFSGGFHVQKWADIKNEDGKHIASCSFFDFVLNHTHSFVIMRSAPTDCQPEEARGRVRRSRSRRGLEGSLHGRCRPCASVVLRKQTPAVFVLGSRRLTPAVFAEGPQCRVQRLLEAGPLQPLRQDVWSDLGYQRKGTFIAVLRTSVLRLVKTATCMYIRSSTVACRKCRRVFPRRSPPCKEVGLRTRAAAVAAAAADAMSHSLTCRVRAVVRASVERHVQCT